MPAVDLVLGEVHGTVDVVEFMDHSGAALGHAVRFFHVKFNHPDQSPKPVELAAAIAAYPYDFYDQCRNVAALNLPRGVGISKELWKRVGENLENDVMTIREIHAAIGEIPVCAAFLVSWCGDYPVSLLDYRMDMATHN